MNTQNRHPRWWQLSLLAPIMMGLLLLDTHLVLSSMEHQIIEVGVVLLMYGAMACWLWANQEALEDENDETGGWHTINLAEDLSEPIEFSSREASELDDMPCYQVVGPTGV